MNFFSSKENNDLKNKIIQTTKELQFEDYLTCQNALIVNELINNKLSSQMCHINGLYCGTMFLDKDFLLLPIIIFEDKKIDYYSDLNIGVHENLRLNPVNHLLVIFLLHL